MWIKCSDRMPDLYKEVLFFAHPDDQHRPTMMIGFFNGFYWTEVYSFYGASTFNDKVSITHWQELPDRVID